MSQEDGMVPPPQKPPETKTNITPPHQDNYYFQKHEAAGMCFTIWMGTRIPSMRGNKTGFAVFAGFAPHWIFRWAWTVQCLGLSSARDHRYGPQDLGEGEVR